MNPVKTITIMAFRKAPGEIFHEVHKHGETFIITKAGKPICELKPIEANEALRIGAAIRRQGGNTANGTLWLNLGDSYAAGGMGGQSKRSDNFGGVAEGYKRAIGPAKKAPAGMKPKDLVGIPWMVAFALRADGWYLRQEKQPGIYWD